MHFMHAYMAAKFHNVVEFRQPFALLVPRVKVPLFQESPFSCRSPLLPLLSWLSIRGLGPFENFAWRER